MLRNQAVLSAVHVAALERSPAINTNKVLQGHTRPAHRTTVTLPSTTHRDAS